MGSGSGSVRRRLPAEVALVVGYAPRWLVSPSPPPRVLRERPPLALESLGFGSYISEVKEVLQECKTVALKRRKASSRLENLGIPEEELLRQQQELFAKARQQQAELAQQEWLQMQQAAQQAQLAAASATASNQAGSSQDEDDEDDI
ncbi:protein Dr1 isoform X2 [Gopherus flavomarginatus]|uniref:protein Dr1 isoform X2 n=1 Tax=Gopherus evgoodei TaxID=1825980 RepID=UPI0011CF9E11|nr:protein Dr1 isoform X2 [Gopherus evgoodei]XP_050818438.1 protein Dr1 isoform X2 [Gopherus flavomarginatus]